MKRIILILLLLLAATLAADVDGSSGFQMLRIISDPVSAAQAGCGSVHSLSAAKFLDNPASSIFTRGSAVTFSHNIWLFDTAMNSLAWRKSNGKSSLGFAIRYLDYGKIDERDDAGQLIGEYHPMDMNLAFNYGRRIFSAHYIGLNLRGIYEKIDDSSAYGISADLGYVYLTPLKEISFLFNLKNFGKTSKLDEEDIKLPLTIEAGLAKSFHLRTTDLNLETRIIKYDDSNDIKAAFGVEAKIYEQFFLRSGYKYNYDLESLSVGFGVQLNRFELSYSYNPISEELDDVHFLGITMLLD